MFGLIGGEVLPDESDELHVSNKAIASILPVDKDCDVLALGIRRQCIEKL